jgi:hypothetical protein
MTARKHHYVPQCYLKGFVRHRDKPRLFVVDAKNRAAFRTAPANVAAERDFHRIDADGFSPDALENSLSGFEAEVSAALDRLVAARSIQDEPDRVLLFNLMALLAVKNPRHRENFRSVQEHIIKRVMDLATATPERWETQIRQAKASGHLAQNAEADYAKMRAFFEAGKFSIKISPHRHLQIELKAFDKILPHIFHRKWILLRAPPKTTGFITSDHPLCLMWSDPEKRGGRRAPGLGLTGTQIVFPVSNELAIVGAFEIREAEWDVSDQLIAQINGAIIVGAERQIYARDSDFIYKLAHNKKIRRGAELVTDEVIRRPPGRD